MKKIILSTIMSVFALQSLVANAATPINSSGKRPVFETIQKMEDQCMGAYTNQFYGAAVRPTLTFIKADSKKVKDEIEVTVHFRRSDVRGVDKYRCSFKNGMLTGHNKVQ
jgi:hypothetical protein